jgi:hypothetical protein
VLRTSERRGEQACLHNAARLSIKLKRAAVSVCARTCLSSCSCARRWRSRPGVTQSTESACVSLANNVHARAQHRAAGRGSTYDAVLALDDGAIVQCPRFFLRLPRSLGIEAD